MNEGLTEDLNSSNIDVGVFEEVDDFFEDDDDIMVASTNQPVKQL